MEIFQDLPIISSRFIIETTERRIIDHVFNLCQWLKNPKGNFFIGLFEKYYKEVINPKLLQCPFKKGRYVAVRAREKNFQASEVQKSAPVYLPTKGNITIKSINKVKIGKIMKNLANITEVYEFFWSWQEIFYRLLS